jgi:hypothetical protein
VDECKPLPHGGEELHDLRARHQEPDAAHVGAQLGRAVHVDPMKPIFKPPRSKRLKLESVVLLSDFTFKFNLRRYNLGGTKLSSQECGYGIDTAGRCRLSPSDPR